MRRAARAAHAGRRAHGPHARTHLHPRRTVERRRAGQPTRHPHRRGVHRRAAPDGRLSACVLPAQHPLPRLRLHDGGPQCAGDRGVQYTHLEGEPRRRAPGRDATGDAAVPRAHAHDVRKMGRGAGRTASAGGHPLLVRHGVTTPAAWRTPPRDSGRRRKPRSTR